MCTDRLRSVHVKFMRCCQRRNPRICFLAASVLLSTLIFLSSTAHSSCRDPDVARGFGSVAYAAATDATIQYFGHSFFLITTRRGARIVTDPLGPGWYPTPHVVGDAVTVGKEHYNHNAVQIVQGQPLNLRGLKDYGADWNKISVSFKDTLIYNVPIHQNAATIEGTKALPSSSIWELSVSLTWGT